MEEGNRSCEINNNGMQFLVKTHKKKRWQHGKRKWKIAAMDLNERFHYLAPGSLDYKFLFFPGGVEEKTIILILIGWCIFFLDMEVCQNWQVKRLFARC